MKISCYMYTQTRVQELETAVEVKDNEALRSLKVSKKASRKREILIDVDENTNPLFINSTSSNDQVDIRSAPMDDVDLLNRVTSDLSCSSKGYNVKFVHNTCAKHTEDFISNVAGEKEQKAKVTEDTSSYSAMQEKFSPDIKHQTSLETIVKSVPPRMDAVASDSKEHEVTGHDCLRGSMGLGVNSRSNKDIPHVIAVDNDVTVIEDDDSGTDQPSLNIRKESSFSLPSSKPGTMLPFE